VTKSDPALRKRNQGSEYAKYMNKPVQKSIICSFSERILAATKSDIQKVQYFALMVDESKKQPW
jgi:hypothetical protein